MLNSLMKGKGVDITPDKREAALGNHFVGGGGGALVLDLDFETMKCLTPLEDIDAAFMAQKQIIAWCLDSDPFYQFHVASYSRENNAFNQLHMVNVIASGSKMSVQNITINPDGSFYHNVNGDVELTSGK